MSQLLVQDFLEKRTFEELAKAHGVYASFSKSGHKWSLNYDQIESEEGDVLAQQCRGLILSAVDGRSFLQNAIKENDRLRYGHICPGGTKILAYPMNRFFNYGQGSAASINWDDPSISVMEKMDGTLITVYYDPFTATWCTATRSVPEADLPLEGGHFTFRTLFEKGIKETSGQSFEEFAKNLHKDYTYCFELTSPFNRVVVKYDETRVTFLTKRHLSSLREVDHEHDSINGVPRVRAYTYASVNDIINWVSSQNPLEHEGVVVKDSNYNRIKVKNAAYVAYNRARDLLGTSDRNCLELILAEKDDDVVAALPQEIVHNLIRIKSDIRNLMIHYDNVYQILLYLTEQTQPYPGHKKTFAIHVSKFKNLWSAPFYQMYEGKVSSMKDFILKHRKNGNWPDTFLDKLLFISRNSSI